MKKLIFLLLLPLHLMAQGANDRVEMANQIFGAEDYPQAEKTYGIILDTPMPRWQKEIVSYNRGTALLAQKKWNEAIQQFEQIEPSNLSSPLLNRNLKTNFALTRLRLGISLLDQKNENEDRDLTMLYNFNEAIRLAEQAKVADCALQNIKGAATCQPAEDLLAIIREARLQLAIGLTKYQQEQLKHPNPERDLSVLLSGLRGTIENINFLQKNALNPAQQKTYLDDFVAQASSWKPLWNALKPSMPKETFPQAHQDFSNGIVSMQKNNLGDSHAQFQAALTSLENMLQEIWGKNPLNLLLEDLYQTYQTVSLQNPLPLLGISGLLEEQKQLTARIATAQKSSFERSTAYLEKSLKFTQQGKSTLANIFFEDAYQGIKDMLESLQPQQAESLIEILQEGLDKQRFALKLNRLRVKLPQVDQAEVVDLIQYRQSLVPAVGPRFLNQAVETQTKQSEEGIRKEGQVEQWKEIMSLVSQGYRKSLEAKKITENPSNAAKGIGLQEGVIEAWYKAIEKIKALQQAKQEPASEQKAQTEQTEIKQIFQDAQEMDKNDRGLRQAIPIKFPGEKPW